jgi:hypothetical protein
MDYAVCMRKVARFDGKRWVQKMKDIEELDEPASRNFKQAQAKQKNLSTDQARLPVAAHKHLPRNTLLPWTRMTQGQIARHTTLKPGRKRVVHQQFNLATRQSHDVLEPLDPTSFLPVPTQKSIASRRLRHSVP